MVTMSLPVLAVQRRRPQIVSVVLHFIHKIFPLRTCTYLINDISIKAGKVNVCLDYHIKRCDGPCEGLVSDQKYGAMIQQIVFFLKGILKRINCKRIMCIPLRNGIDLFFFFF